MLRQSHGMVCGLCMFAVACGGRDQNAQNTGAGGSDLAADAGDLQTSDAGAVTPVPEAAPGPCDPKQNALTTGSAAWDEYDCLIIELSQKLGHPDPRVIKSQIMQESSYHMLAVSPDSPCGVHEGWTDAESKSYGLIQVTLACGEAGISLLPDGHPNLTQDPSSELWETSIFNPKINLEQGIERIVAGMSRLKTRHPGCSETDYTLMAAGAYNSGNRAVQGCMKFNERAGNYVNSVLGRYISFASVSNWPNPYPMPPI